MVSRYLIILAVTFLTRPPLTLSMIRRPLHPVQIDVDSSADSASSPRISRRSSASSAFFDENEFKFLARRRQVRQSPVPLSPASPKESVPAVTVSRPPQQGLIRTVVRELCGVLIVEHWLLLKDVAMCVWRYVQRVSARLDSCRVASFGLLQALA